MSESYGPGAPHADHCDCSICKPIDTYTLERDMGRAKDIARMSAQELRNELTLARKVVYIYEVALVRIAAQQEGCLASLYEDIAQRALDATREKA